MIRRVFVLMMLFSGCAIHRHSNRSSIQKEAEQVLIQQVGYETRSLQRNPLIVYLIDWYGVPYTLGKCEKKGIDCSCFCKQLYESVYKKTLPRTVREIYTHCDKIAVRKLQEGDLVFFKITGDVPDHIGVYLKSGYFVHASSSKGVVISSLENSYYKKYYYSSGRI